MENITNYNIAFNTNFKLEIPSYSTTNYFLQQVTLPSISNTGQELYYKHHQTATYSNVTEWSSLNTVILMDEDFENYIQLCNWMRSFIDDDDWHNLVKDIKLHILSANKKVLLTYSFYGSFPTMLGEVSFDSSNLSPTPISFNVEFRYQWFEFKREILN